MLLNLKISNYALIDNLDVDFTNEFTVISGEKARIVKTLVEIDPTNSSKYQKINESNKGR